MNNREMCLFISLSPFANPIKLSAEKEIPKEWQELFHENVERSDKDE